MDEVHINLKEGGAELCIDKAEQIHLRRGIKQVQDVYKRQAY